jgi:AraC-like DNA-binding protein
MVASTRGLAPREREEFWREAMSEAFVPLDVASVDAERFTGSIRTREVGELMIADLSSSPQEVRRTPRLIADSERHLMQVAVAQRGRAYLAQDGREVLLRQGDFVVYETARPFRWAFDGDWTATVFTVPRERLALSAAESSRLTARLLPGRSGLTRVVSEFLRGLAANVDDLPARQSRRVVTDVADLVLALLDDGDRPAVLDWPAGGRVALLVRIKDHIERNLADPALCPASIAAAHHVSVRYLHKLFAAEELTVSGYVRGRRLRRCALQMRDPRLAEVPIAVLAGRAGFGDLSGFGRAFKASFGMTPSQYRCSR